VYNVDAASEPINNPWGRSLFINPKGTLPEGIGYIVSKVLSNPGHKITVCLVCVGVDGKCLWAMRPDGSGSVEIFDNDVSYLPSYAVGSHSSRLIDIVRRGCPGNEDNLSSEEMIKLVTWVDSNGQYYGSYYGRRNLRYKNHPNFRPVPTFEQAVSMLPPKDDKDR
jgi:hypothetical protein